MQLRIDHSLFMILVAIYSSYMGRGTYTPFTQQKVNRLELTWTQTCLDFGCVNAPKLT